MSAWTSKPPERLAPWARLRALARARPDRQSERARGERAFEERSQRLGPVLLDHGKQRLGADAETALVNLAAASGMERAIADLAAGSAVNHTEGRPARHMETRKGAADAMPEVLAERERFMDFAEAVRAGEHRGATGEPIATVVHVGMGGSHLGPQLATEALRRRGGPEIRFLANVDGAAVTAALADLDPNKTLVAVVSKSFDTLETRANANAIRAWFVANGATPDAVSRHFVAITANARGARDFGVPADRQFRLWDWLGGRFSLWSAAGLPVAIACGRRAFEEMLAGARLVDEHFTAAPLAANAPLRLALLQVWNTNFLGAETHAVLCYDHRLRLLPAYLQQLEMESNGKSTRRDGAPTASHTAPVIWGGEETGGQHAFHQLLHQGTRAFSADFVVCARASHPLTDHHDWLLANCLAQSKAMAEGRDAAEPHKRVAGGHPSTTLLLDELNPKSFGALLALYEHKVFCAGVIWQINPFDQWGVQLGKEMAATIHKQLTTGDAAGQDASTRGLLSEIRRLRSDARPAPGLDVT